ncbi:MAG TPA: hypothetical protein GX734_03545 [Clostridiaceae bacterium]|nr:hypothetical protein [Clostridiaceae bacterium]
MKTPRGEISDSLIELAKDEAIIQKMSECKDAEEMYALVKDRVGIPFEQFTAEMGIAYSYLQEMEAGLLTEEDLDAVAGGKSGKEVFATTTTVVATGAAVLTMVAKLATIL